MSNMERFKPMVESMVRKNLATLPGFTAKDLKAECWAAVVAGIKRWDGCKGRLEPWVYTIVSGRIRDLRKKALSQKKGETLLLTSIRRGEPI